MLGIAAISGAGTMVVELAAVRLLAPWFGTSLVVWTNVIAVVLLALSLGYLIGGRLATGGAPLRALGWTLLSASGLVAWVPLLGAAISRWLLPDQIALHQAAGLVQWGSLAASVVAFLPAATLLGTVCPLVVEGLARARQLQAGSAGGLVLFVSTLGSLLGVFSTSHVLLPTLGLQRTFLLAAAVLFAAGGLTWFLARKSRLQALVPLLFFCFGSATTYVRPGDRRLPPDRVELARRESAYQSLRVIEDRTQNIRMLQVNEGFDSFQSVWQAKPGCLPEGFYYNDFLLPLSWSEPTESWRVLVLGLGAGTVIRVFADEERAGMRFVGVELDPTVVELGRELFELREDEHVAVRAGLDARVALLAEQGPFEQIVLDCYSNQVEIPSHLCTLEFFADLRARLVEGGWLTANLGGFGFDDPVVTAVARTCADAFGAPALLVRVPKARNYMLVARKDASVPWERGVLTSATRTSSLDLGPRLLPGFAKLVEPRTGGLRLTDDLCPIERLQALSIGSAFEKDGSSSGS